MGKRNADGDSHNIRKFRRVHTDEIVVDLEMEGEEMNISVRQISNEIYPIEPWVTFTLESS